jgi:hypothetical protein
MPELQVSNAVFIFTNLRSFNIPDGKNHVALVKDLSVPSVLDSSSHAFTMSVTTPTI